MLYYFLELAGAAILTEVIFKKNIITVANMALEHPL